MERLGEKDIFSIFELIPNIRDKKSFSKVCKIFLKVACFHLRRLDNQFPDMLFDMLIASPKMFSFKCDKALSNNHLLLIAESCPNIEHISLERHCIVREEGKLDFDDIGLCAIAKACIHLKSVDLTKRLCFGEMGISSLVRSCKNLRMLDLSSCKNVTDKSLKMIGEATHLETLYLLGCNLISDLGLEYLADGDLKHCLKTLRLTYCGGITGNDVVHLQKLVSLRHLSLSGCGVNITDHGVVALCKLPNIAILSLDYLVNLTDISLREIGSKCLELTNLCLNGCENITDVGLRAFTGHQNLCMLSLRSCYKLSLEEVKSIVMSCPRMWCLCLSKSMKQQQPEARHDSFNYGRCEIRWD